MQDEDGSGEFKGEILDFYRTGDVAPGGRFKYVYTFKDDDSEPVVTTGAVTTEAATDETPSDTVGTTSDVTTEAQTNSGSNMTPVIIGLVVAVLAVVGAFTVIIIKNKKK